MNHKQATARLVELEEGSLAPAERRELQEHLAVCDACRAWHETYDRLASALAPEPKRHPSSDLVARWAVDRSTVSDREAAEFELHLETCEACRSELAVAEAALEPESSDERVPAFAPLPTRGWRSMVPAALAATVLLALAAVFFLRDAGSGAAASPDRALADMSLDGSQTIEAERSITTAGVRIAGGSDVILRAGSSVTLGEGFTIDSDAHFRVELLQPQDQPRPRSAQRR